MEWVCAMSLGDSLKRDFKGCGVNGSSGIVPLVSSTGMTYNCRTSSPMIVKGALTVTGRTKVHVKTRPNFPSLVNFKEEGLDISPTRTGTCILCRLNTLSTFYEMANMGVRRMGPRKTLCGVTTRSCTLSATVYRTVGRFSDDLVMLTLSNKRLTGTTRSVNLHATVRIFTSHTCRRSNALMGEHGRKTIVASRGRTVIEIVHVIGRGGVATVAKGSVSVRTSSIYIRKSKTGTLTFIRGVERTFMGRKVRVDSLSRFMGWGGFEGGCWGS